MAVIRITTLNSNLDDSLRAAKLPEKNVAEVSASLKASAKSSFRIILIVMGFLAVFMGGMLAYTMSRNLDMRENMSAWIIGFVVLLGVLFGGSYLITCGLVKIQFNGALKEGYPELYKKYKV